MAEPPELGVAAPLEFVGYPAFRFQPPRLGYGRSLSTWPSPGPNAAEGMGFPHRLRIQQSMNMSSQARTMMTTS